MDNQSSKILMYKNLFKIGLAVLLIGSCFEDAARENPLDPANGTQYMVEGTVSTFFEPRSAIERAIIMVEGEDKTAITSADGRYVMDMEKPGTYRITCSAEGFFADTVHITISQKHTVNFRLNARPSFAETQLTSHRISRWFPVEDVYFLEARVLVEDADGPADIQLVTMDIPVTQTRDTLELLQQSGRWFSRIYDYDLPITSIHDLIGNPVIFNAYNNDSMVTRSDDIYLTRVIETEPLPVTPNAFETVPADSIVFGWERVYLPYAFELRVTIFSVDLGLLIEVDRIESISQNADGYVYRHNLPAGDYFWTLTIVDRFGNTSRSKESTFRVE